MADKVFMQGNEAFAEAAIRSGCKYFFGYPIMQRKLLQRDLHLFRQKQKFQLSIWLQVLQLQVKEA